MVSRHLGDGEIMNDDSAGTSAEAESAARPVNADGTTNWSVVFDDPTRGIMVVLRAVSTIDQLRAVMDNVALLLFKRRHDAEPRTEFRARIARIIEDHNGDLEYARVEILLLLGTIRDDRIAKAEQYSRNKAMGQSVERRREETKSGLLATLFSGPLRIGLVVLGLSAVGALVVLLIPRTEEEPPSIIRTDPGSGASAPSYNQASPARREESKEEQKTPPPPPPPARDDKPRISVLAMKPLALSVVLSGQERRQAYMALIPLGEGDDISALCALSPWLMEGVTLRVHALTEKGQEATAAAMRGIADGVRKDINAKGKAKLSSLSLVNTRDLPRSAVNAAHAGCVRVELERLP